MSTTETKEHSASRLATTEERRAMGKALREKVSRKEHALWAPASDRDDPIGLLEKSSEGRVSELIPIRYGRMMKSPFTFYRGSAAVMAADLAKTPVSGIQVQACGDCHLLNFGAYATPERNLIVDINDFDETLPAPWEWDVKRLAASFVLACRANGFKDDICKASAETVVRSYRSAMRDFSEMKVMDVWYSKMDLERFIEGMKDAESRKQAKDFVAKQKEKSIVDYYVPKLTIEEAGKRRFKEAPPLVYHPEELKGKKFFKIAQDTFEEYKNSLSHERRVLIDHFELNDVAMKIVGIGSVGTFCAVLLLMAGKDDPLILQVKEARASVLEPYVGKSTFKTHGQRVVVGQRLMQAHSDIFLGWTVGTGELHRHFYLRQLKDMKMSMTPEVWTTQRALEVAEALGWVLARAHARSGDAAMISGYLGNKDVFDKAVAEFSMTYADQSELDHRALMVAIKSGRLEAYVER